MKAISIRQPWAKLIAQGINTIEVRSWKTNHRGDILIVSSAKPDDFMKAITKNTNPENGIFCIARTRSDSDLNDYYHLGKAICIAELYAVEPMTHADEKAAMCYADENYYSWKLQNIRLIEPFSVKGQLGFYEINHENLQR